jgi:hypothetical protein
MKIQKINSNKQFKTTPQIINTKEQRSLDVASTVGQSYIHLRKPFCNILEKGLMQHQPAKQK